MPLISVFTPTYNRAGKIHRVFNSLVKQTLQDFEWIIVDDGSTDNTKAIVEAFKMREPRLQIIYIYQPNAGKHIAINNGLAIAAGQWFHIADSDDEIDPATLETFMRTFAEIPGPEQDEFCGIVASCKDQFGNRITDPVPGGIYDGHLKPLYYKYKFRKEFFHIYKTGILKKFPFPDYIRNNVVPEAIIWKKMTEKYKVRVISHELRTYYMNEDEFALMSTKGKSPSSKALSSCLESSNVLNCDMKYFFYYPQYFFRMAVVYHCFRPFLKKEQVKLVPLKLTAKLFAFPFIFAGLIFTAVLNRKYSKQQQAVI